MSPVTQKMGLRNALPPAPNHSLSQSKRQPAFLPSPSPTLQRLKPRPAQKEIRSFLSISSPYLGSRDCLGHGRLRTLCPRGLGFRFLIGQRAGAGRYRPGHQRLLRRPGATFIKQRFYSKRSRALSSGPVPKQWLRDFTYGKERLYTGATEQLSPQISLFGTEGTKIKIHRYSKKPWIFCQ